MNKRDKTESVTFDNDELDFKPVTPGVWADLELLFSERGVQNGCWCMYWRISRKEFQQNYGEENKRLIKEMVASGVVPGILAYHKGRPVGWCSVASRDDYPVVLRSPILKPIDEQPVWSIVCFFVSKPYRKSGLTHLLIKAAIKYAGEHGARIIESYPVDAGAKYIEYQRYLGLHTTFKKEGFKEVARRSAYRPIMRYYLGKS